ncbi:Bcr/CflA family efflux MFS transporter [Rhodobacterales bacterium HKCCE2091]|nr:Bcr/CflA family efflux MFS transporter [Rhodobacterales bacterium HKCCE2091]
MTDATSPARPALGRTEFIALMAMMVATIAFSVDAMLPALPEIADELTPEAPTLAQFILTSFILGMGVGTLIVGPASDTLGRKPVILAGAALYVAGAIMAYFAPTLELVIVARVLQGLGASGPRVVSLAMIRDLYSGRQMASIVSFVMLIFTLFPAVAPLMGTAIIAGLGWRGIFLAFLLFSVVSVAWLMIRQPETLPPAARRKLSASDLMAGFGEAIRHPQMYLSIIVQGLIFGALFGTISSIQQVFDMTYGRAEGFPVYFFAIAVCAMWAAPTNAKLVLKLGMRPIIRAALAAQVGFASLMLAILLTGILGDAEFWAYFAWSVTCFAMLGFTIGNLNALALEPLGHIAGMASALMGAVATVAGAVIGGTIGQLYDGTVVPLAASVLVLCAAAWLFMRRMPREASDR